MNWYLDGLKKYAVFTGRDRRKSYWMYTLYNVIIIIVLSIVDSVLGTMMAGGMGILTLAYELGTLLPSVGIGIRRLHDIGRSGWWLLISLVPLIGLIVLIYFLVQDSQPGANAYGPNPKGT